MNPKIQKKIYATSKYICHLAIALCAEIKIYMFFHLAEISRTFYKTDTRHTNPILDQKLEMKFTSP
jgi:hypothetical protein